jgi:hypothetical protein
VYSRLSCAHLLCVCTPPLRDPLSFTVDEPETDGPSITALITAAKEATKPFQHGWMRIKKGRSTLGSKLRYCILALAPTKVFYYYDSDLSLKPVGFLNLEVWVFVFFVCFSEVLQKVKVTVMYTGMALRYFFTS